MTIEVKYIESEPLKLTFEPYGDGKRLWIRDNGWYPSVGWCPHYHLGYRECLDCALVLETEDDD